MPLVTLGLLKGKNITIAEEAIEKVIVNVEAMAERIAMEVVEVAEREPMVKWR